MKLPGVRIAGIGTNLTCFGAILPSEENLDELVGHARQLETVFGLDLAYLSGGNSSSLPLLLAGKMPSGINNLRVGEAILQGGCDTFLDEPWQTSNAMASCYRAPAAKYVPRVPLTGRIFDGDGQFGPSSTYGRRGQFYH